MRSFSRCRVLLALAICLSVSCSLWRGGREAEDEMPTEPEETFDPFAYPGDDEVVTISQPDDSSDQIDTSLYYIATDSSSAYPEKVYRVQVVTGQDFQRALEEKAMAEEAFAEPVRVGYKAPYYWIEIGNFASEEEANDFLDLAKSRGYPKCWVTSEAVDSLFWIELAADSAVVDSVTESGGR